MKIGQYLFSPKGKINKKEFALSLLLAGSIVAVLIFGPSIIAHFNPHPASFTAIAKLLTALSYVSGVLLFLYSGIVCLGVKRLRDIGISPWWILLSFVPYVNILYFLLFFYPSKHQNEATLPRESFRH